MALKIDGDSVVVEERIVHIEEKKLSGRLA
jgi:hypothetical protein